MPEESRKTNVLVPFDAREAISLAEAAKLATVSETTVMRWCKRDHIGRKVGGIWRVSRIALQMYLDDNGRALVAYLHGDRTAPHVAVYFVSFGIEDLLRSASFDSANPANSSNAARTNAQ